ncbi:MAG: DUF2283 domain-containing protein [Nanoarchaeota archaeon]|nr:DUF2283 domain-containing protein [Nanoarchaeota archaeon]MBU1104156.1 DUF2283 domain-containing protein [Nanoarchaeota archaeon]
MEEFKISYDEDNDDLFMFLDGSKSAGAVEIGNFVFDFDKDEKLIAIQILNASEVLSKLMKKIISLTRISKIKVEVINFRNMDAIEIELEKERIPIIIPRIREGSPALRY